MSVNRSEYLNIFIAQLKTILFIDNSTNVYIRDAVCLRIKKVFNDMSDQVVIFAI